MKNKTNNKVLIALKIIQEKFFQVNDSPSRIAFGLALGVFTGIVPGIGPVAAFFLSGLLGANRMLSLLGSLLTNGWLSFATFILSVKLGAGIMGVDGQGVLRGLRQLMENFQWQTLFRVSILKALLPLCVGYLVVAFFAAFLAYCIALLFLLLRRKAVSALNATKHKK